MMTMIPTALTVPRERAWSTARAQVLESSRLDSACTEPRLSARQVADLRRAASELRRRSYDKLFDTSRSR